MKLVALIPAILVLSACTTAAHKTRAVSQAEAAHAIDYGNALEAESSTAVDVTAYNKIIAAQGVDYYCGAGTCDTTPLLISGYAPVYPPALIASGITGSATVVFTIDENGNVVDARIESATQQEFADSSLIAVKTWRFRPASLGGKPVRNTSRQQFPFSLR